MDQIDINLLDAWHRIGVQCQRDPRKALVRMRRRLKKSVFQPPRAWCLSIRAADTRINRYRAVIDPPYADEQLLEHDVTLDGSLIRFLTKPVFIPWPGVPAWQAAAKLGMSRNMALDWMKKGYLRCEGRYNGIVPGKAWIKCPMVWTPSPIDANHAAGRPPDRIWGTLWQSLSHKFPEHFEQVVRRSPRYRPRLGRTHFMGWDWICPGRTLADGTTKVCGRRCKYLFAPLPVWTLAKSSSSAFALEMPPDSGLAGAWEPGLQDVAVGEGCRTLACKECWRIRSVSLIDYRGWNDFVSHISGGLLYGREVARPLEEAPMKRTRQASLTRAATRRANSLAKKIGAARVAGNEDAATG